MDALRSDHYRPPNSVCIPPKSLPLLDQKTSIPSPPLIDSLQRFQYPPRHLQESANRASEAKEGAKVRHKSAEAVDAVDHFIAAVVAVVVGELDKDGVPRVVPGRPGSVEVHGPAVAAVVVVLVGDDAPVESLADELEKVVAHLRARGAAVKSALDADGDAAVVGQVAHHLCLGCLGAANRVLAALLHGVPQVAELRRVVGEIAERAALGACGHIDHVAGDLDASLEVVGQAPGRHGFAGDGGVEQTVGRPLVSDTTRFPDDVKLVELALDRFSQGIEGRDSDIAARSCADRSCGRGHTDSSQHANGARDVLGGHVDSRESCIQDDGTRWRGNDAMHW
jgi:hypothetical protein